MSAKPAPNRAELPIDAHIPHILAKLRTFTTLVVTAPPGSGKTTRIAPAILETLDNGAVWLVGPRRLAVRAAATRIAAERGVVCGGAVGYQSRDDSRVGPDTRLIAMTYGVFRQRLIADPELTGVAAVLFDEVHERSVDSDLSLALVRDAQVGLTLQTRLIAMSATVDAARFAAFLGDAPVTHCEGTPFPLELRHLPPATGEAPAHAITTAIRRAMAEQPHDILAFCPSMSLMRAVARGLTGPAFAGVEIHQLWSGASAAAQDRAMRKSPPNQRRIVLATAIAESSLTLDGVRCVVDCGLSRRASIDPLTGLTRLHTTPSSQATAHQRSGRAARQAPGIAYRLWPEAAFRGRAAFDPPEILDADLARTVLDCARWGIGSADAIDWLTPPPPIRWMDAVARCQTIGAIDATRRATPLAESLGRLGVAPILGAMVLAAGSSQRTTAAELATLIEDLSLGRHSDDLEARLRWLRDDQGRQAESARRSVSRLVRLANDQRPSIRMDRRGSTVATMVASAYPRLVAKRRQGGDGRYLSVGGRAFSCDPCSSLVKSPWLVVIDAVGTPADAQIKLALPITESEAWEAAGRYRAHDSEVVYDQASDRAIARTSDRLGAIILSSGRAHVSDAIVSINARLDWLKSQPQAQWPIPEAAMALLDRAAYAEIEALTPKELVRRIDDWAPQMLAQCDGIKDVKAEDWIRSLRSLLTDQERREFDRVTPESYTTPAGSVHQINYGAGKEPTVRCRLQSVLGLKMHPVVGPRHHPVRFELTSPADRVIHTTCDVPSFWTSAYSDVAKEMRGRYPRHYWPADPSDATATLSVKSRAR